MRAQISTEVGYVGLLFALFVLPRVLQRWRIPSAITSLGLGIAAGPLGLFEDDATVKLLSTLGITTLFLFAGLDVQLGELRARAGVLVEHVAMRLLLLIVFALAAARVLEIGPRAASLLALGLLTPSAGFILDSLDSLGSSKEERQWIRCTAIATEMVALIVMFVALQSATVIRLAWSSAALVAMTLVLPLVFRAFAAWIVPHAPKSEFAFLVMLAVLCALATRKLGVYYLVGAFLVGMSAQSFRERLPAMTSERMLHAVEAFASLFVPFYFFHAGLELRAQDFQVESFLWGAAFLLLGLPVRLGVDLVHRRIRLAESFSASWRVTVPMIPTLVFTLVIAEILRDQFRLPAPVFGGLIVYTVVNTMLPSLTLRAPTPEFDTPDLPPLSEAAGISAGSERRA